MGETEHIDIVLLYGKDKSEKFVKKVYMQYQN